MTATVPAAMRREDLPADCRAAAALLNQGCVCRSVDSRRLKRALEAGGVAHEALTSSHPHLFSHTQVYVAQAHLDFMADLVRAIERVVALPAWQARVLADAPVIASHIPRAASVFMGYDFHLGDDGPRLIEINTNAGGALLCAKLLHAQEACCASLPPPSGVPAETLFLDMFRSEWQLARDEAPLTRIAIVDETPSAQFLAPEFELFRQLFEADGIATLIVDPQEFSFVDGGLYARGERIDLVYNRLTDFSLDDPKNEALRDAYLADAVVLTPQENKLLDVATDIATTPPSRTENMSSAIAPSMIWLPSTKRAPSAMLAKIGARVCGGGASCTRSRASAAMASAAIAAATA